MAKSMVALVHFGVLVSTGTWMHIGEMDLDAVATIRIVECDRS